MMVIMVEGFILVVLVYLLFCLIFYKKNNEAETVSPYECGFDPNCMSRMTFSYRFFLISILFMIFDVEISLMLPIPFLIGMSESILLFYLFVLILIIGLIYEYYCGSLDWLDSFVSKA